MEEHEMCWRAQRCRKMKGNIFRFFEDSGHNVTKSKILQVRNRKPREYKRPVKSF